jgi:threonine synthase
MTTWLRDDGPTGSCLAGLQGSLSADLYSADELTGTNPVDGRPLLARYDLRAAAATLTRAALTKRRTGGLWRWREILPVRQWKHVVSLGEGSCPLFPARRLGKAFGLPHLMVKAESLNPTGSFKARGMAVAVSRAVELGVTQFVVASAGNAAGAMAAYAACAGVSAIVVMPADAPMANQVEVLIQGAQLVLLEGLISDCGRFASVISQHLGAFDLSTLREPYRLEGKKTMGLELAEELEWTLPDAIVYPTGGGTGLVGMWKAFAELEEMGFISSQRPRMISVQAEGCAPIVRAFQAGDRFAAPWEHPSTEAAGIRVPSALGDFLMLDAIRASGGTAVTVEEASIADMQAFMTSTTGQFVGLESAAAAASLPTLVQTGKLSKTDRIVLFDTGSGFKSSPPTGLHLPHPVANDPAKWGDVIERLTTTTVPA